MKIKLMVLVLCLCLVSCANDTSSPRSESYVFVVNASEASVWNSETQEMETVKDKFFNYMVVVSDSYLQHSSDGGPSYGGYDTQELAEGALRKTGPNELFKMASSATPLSRSAWSVGSPNPDWSAYKKIASAQVPFSGKQTVTGDYGEEFISFSRDTGGWSDSSYVSSGTVVAIYRAD